MKKIKFNEETRVIFKGFKGAIVAVNPDDKFDVVFKADSTSVKELHSGMSIGYKCFDGSEHILSGNRQYWHVFSRDDWDKMKLIELEFNPKRGDTVMVGNCHSNMKRIFITYIEGARVPYVTVHPKHVYNFKAGLPFNTAHYAVVAPASEPVIEVRVDGEIVELPHHITAAIKGEFDD